MLKTPSLISIQLIPLFLELAAVGSHTQGVIHASEIMEVVLQFLNSQHSLILLKIDYSESSGVLIKLLKCVIKRLNSCLQEETVEQATEQLSDAMACFDSFIISLAHLTISYSLQQLSDTCTFFILKLYSIRDLMRLFKLVGEVEKSGFNFARIKAKIWMHICLVDQDTGAVIFELMMQEKQKFKLFLKEFSSSLLYDFSSLCPSLRSIGSRAASSLLQKQRTQLNDYLMVLCFAPQKSSSILQKVESKLQDLLIRINNPQVDPKILDQCIQPVQVLVDLSSTLHGCYQLSNLYPPFQLSIVIFNHLKALQSPKKTNAALLLCHMLAEQLGKMPRNLPPKDDLQISDLMLKTLGLMYEQGLLGQIVISSLPFYIAHRHQPLNFCVMGEEARNHLHLALELKDNLDSIDSNRFDKEKEDYFLKRAKDIKENKEQVATLKNHQIGRKTKGNLEDWLLHS